MITPGLQPMTSCGYEENTVQNESLFKVNKID